MILNLPARGLTEVLFLDVEGKPILDDNGDPVTELMPIAVVTITFDAYVAAHVAPETYITNTAFLYGDSHYPDDDLFDVSYSGFH